MHSRVDTSAEHTEFPSPPGGCLVARHAQDGAPVLVVARRPCLAAEVRLDHPRLRPGASWEVLGVLWEFSVCFRTWIAFLLDWKWLAIVWRVLVFRVFRRAFVVYWECSGPPAPRWSNRVHTAANEEGDSPGPCTRVADRAPRQLPGYGGC